MTRTAPASVSAPGVGAHAEHTDPPPLRSEDLLGGARVRIIEHAGERYCLRLTRKGKLILSK